MSDKKTKHLCKLVKKDFLKDNLYEYSDLVRNPEFICTKCGRVAVEKHYLCKPEGIKKTA